MCHGPLLAQWSPPEPESFAGRVGPLRFAIVLILLAAFAATIRPETSISSVSNGAVGSAFDQHSGEADQASETDTTRPGIPAPAGPDQAIDNTGSAWVPSESSGQPWSELGAVEGLLTFRGNPTRSFYGTGPMPTAPEVLWQYEVGCSLSTVAGVVKEWCGTGWTGQPVVFPPTPKAQQQTSSQGKDDQWWVAFGGFDRQVNFLDAKTGLSTHAPYRTADIIKGTVTVDPDGFPLIYTGSRDNNFHVVAIDRVDPVGLWQLSAYDNGPTLWNNDWDGSALIVDDYLFVGGENSRFYFVKLNRSYGADGLVDVDPEVVASVASWDDELLRSIGDVEVSIENSPAISGNVVYFANSGGLVQGWDISGLTKSEPPTQVFRFWAGDDTDASIVADTDGMLYVATETQRSVAGSGSTGQLFKLDPTKIEDPVVWSASAGPKSAGGIFATPSLYEDKLVVVPTDGGQLLGFDQTTGARRWSVDLPGPLWSSPVIVDDALIQGDCSGRLNQFDLGDDSTAKPTLTWSVSLNGCIESTPAVWNGQIFVGTRAGTFYSVGEPS